MKLAASYPYLYPFTLNGSLINSLFIFSYNSSASGEKMLSPFGQAELGQICSQHF